MSQSDSERLAVLWTKAQPTVAGYISSLVPDFHQAEDVLHQVAVVLVRKFADYDPLQPFTAWAIGIARLEVLKHRRRWATDRHVFAEETMAKVAVEYQQSAGELEDRRAALRDCMTQVEGRAREALEMQYVDGLKPAAIAERLEMHPAATRTMLSRVRGSLRDCIERRVKSWEEHP